MTAAVAMPLSPTSVGGGTQGNGSASRAQELETQTLTAALLPAFYWMEAVYLPSSPRAEMAFSTSKSPSGNT